jgi:hypothetical protein
MRSTLAHPALSATAVTVKMEWRRRVATSLTVTWLLHFAREFLAQVDTGHVGGVRWRHAVELAPK